MANTDLSKNTYSLSYDGSTVQKLLEYIDNFNEYDRKKLQAVINLIDDSENSDNSDFSNSLSKFYDKILLKDDVNKSLNGQNTDYPPSTECVASVKDDMQSQIDTLTSDVESLFQSTYDTLRIEWNVSSFSNSSNVHIRKFTPMYTATLNGKVIAENEIPTGILSSGVEGTVNLYASYNYHTKSLVLRTYSSSSISAFWQIEGDESDFDSGRCNIIIPIYKPKDGDYARQAVIHSHDNLEILDDISEENLTQWNNSASNEIVRNLLAEFSMLKTICQSYLTDIQNLSKAIGINLYDGGWFGTTYNNDVLDGGALSSTPITSFDCGDFAFYDYDGGIFNGDTSDELDGGSF